MQAKDGIGLDHVRTEEKHSPAPKCESLRVVCPTRTSATKPENLPHLLPLIR